MQIIFLAAKQPVRLLSSGFINVCVGVRAIHTLMALREASDVYSVLLSTFLFLSPFPKVHDKTDLVNVLLGLFFCRSVLLNHMANDHAFNIGLPDNIVNCKTFLDVLQKQLDRYVAPFHLLSSRTRFVVLQVCSTHHQCFH